DYFERKAYTTASYSRCSLLTDYGEFLNRSNDTTIRKGIATLEDIALHAGSMWERYAAAHAIHEVKESLNDKTVNGVLSAEQRESLTKELAAILEQIITAEKSQSLQERYQDFQ
ncbi:MAG TPA: hypothetical protein VNJ07_01725, partial [Chitinophagales bacterium]|nr:hypothetical protein [Chitinophagales bacterium]